MGAPLFVCPDATEGGPKPSLSSTPASWVKSLHITGFVAFGPTTSTPRYVVAVVIDQAGYGAAAAAPVARQIFTYLTNHPVGSADLHPPSNAP